MSLVLKMGKIGQTEGNAVIHLKPLATNFMCYDERKEGPEGLERGKDPYSKIARSLKNI